MTITINGSNKQLIFDSEDASTGHVNLVDEHGYHISAFKISELEAAIAAIKAIAKV